MTAISLRAYNREIEAMIDRGQNDDAVTHCKYILKYFPKHVGTYRLLGKAFLESHHYSEAADILQRVLSVVPDDFISNIGMSIIREDEGNLDAAIWHMERAFEVQPSNTAVQGELRRLYGLRDGIEPPKVRLTRGALVRMYAKSELYPQAIAELLAALAEDPQRVDLETILAQMYFKSGKKIEAAEICSRLISKLPYCLEANKLLAEILPTTSRAEEAKIFKQHLTSLDPYYGHISSTVTLVDDVPDNAVMLERFEAVSEDTRIQPLTTNMPATVEAEQQEVIPDWLPKNQEVTATESPFQPIEGTPSLEQRSFPVDQVGTNKETPPMSQDAPVPPMDNQIPEWMRDAGWTQSEDTPPESVGDSSKSEAGKEEEIVPAELPDWLKSMAPAEENESSANNPQEDEKLGILNTILSGAPGEDSSSNDAEEPMFESTGGAVTRLFSEEAIRKAEQSASVEPEANPSSQVAANAVSDEKAESLPDWLEEPDPSKTEAPESAATSATAEAPATQPVEEPATISNEAPEEAPDWLKALANENPPNPEATSPTPQPLAEETKTDWIKGIFDETEEDENGYANDNKRGSTKQLEEEIPSAMPENTPDWLKQPPSNPEKESTLQSDIFAQQTEATQQYTEPVTQPSSALPRPIPQEQPVIENTPEATEREDLPDWLQELENNQPAQQTAQPAAAAANIDPSLKEWLDTLDAEKAAETKAVPEPEAPKAEPVQQPEPTAEVPVTPESAHQPAEPLPDVKAGVTVSVQPEEGPDSNQPMPTPVEKQPTPVAPVEPVSKPPSPARKMTPLPVQSKAVSGKKRPFTSIVPDEVLAQARHALAAEKTDEAAGLYGQLIRANEKLDDIVHDLQDASHRHPLDVSIWQALGDCYAKNKQLQEALNAYTKAEELLR